MLLLLLLLWLLRIQCYRGRMSRVDRMRAQLRKLCVQCLDLRLRIGHGRARSRQPSVDTQILLLSLVLLLVLRTAGGNRRKRSDGVGRRQRVAQLERAQLFRNLIRSRSCQWCSLCGHSLLLLLLLSWLR